MLDNIIKSFLNSAYPTQMMECNTTVFGTTVNQAISMLQLQNMTGHFLKWVTRNIRAFWLNEESREKVYCNENFEFPLWFILFIILNFKYIIKILNSSINSFKIYLLFSNDHPNIPPPPRKSLLKVGCVSNSKYCGSIMMFHQWFTLISLLTILLDLQKFKQVTDKLF